MDQELTKDEKKALEIVAYLLPAIITPLGFPLALKLIPPGGAYGFRTAKSLESLEAWYSMNFVGGIGLTIAGLLSLAFVYSLHKGERSGSIRKLFTSLAFCLFAIFIAIAGTLWLG